MFSGQVAPVECSKAARSWYPYWGPASSSASKPCRMDIYRVCIPGRARARPVRLRGGPAIERCGTAVRRLSPVEFGLDRPGFGVIELGEDGQGLLPRAAGGAEVAGGLVGVAETG